MIDTTINLEDLPMEFRQKIAQDVHKQWIDNLKNQGVEVHEFKMELIEVEDGQ